MGILCVSCVAMISFYILTKIKHLYSFRLFRLLLLRVDYDRTTAPDFDAGG